MASTTPGGTAAFPGQLALLRYRAPPASAYFRGPFCMDLLYALALRGLSTDGAPAAEIQADPAPHRMSWIGNGDGAGDPEA